MSQRLAFIALEACRAISFPFQAILSYWTHILILVKKNYVKIANIRVIFIVLIQFTCFLLGAILFYIYAAHKVRSYACFLSMLLSMLKHAFHFLSGADIKEDGAEQKASKQVPLTCFMLETPDNLTCTKNLPWLFQPVVTLDLRNFSAEKLSPNQVWSLTQLTQLKKATH